MKTKMTVNGIKLRRGIKPGIWYSNVFGHPIQFRSITGWRSPRIKSWKAEYIFMGEPECNGPLITHQRTLKDCVFETQLHLLPDRERAKPKEVETAL